MCYFVQLAVLYDIAVSGSLPDPEALMWLHISFISVMS